MQYTIQLGDSLHSIAMTYGTTISNLLSLNPQISNPDEIYPGESITVDSQYNGGNQYYGSNQYYNDNQYGRANQYDRGNQYGHSNRGR